MLRIFNPISEVSIQVFLSKKAIKMGSALLEWMPSLIWGIIL